MEAIPLDDSKFAQSPAPSPQRRCPPSQSLKLSEAEASQENDTDSRQSSQQDLDVPLDVSPDDSPPGHVVSRAELERRRRGDAQPQIVPSDLMAQKKVKTATSRNLTVAGRIS